MAITLADLAVNTDDKLVEGFVNELITDSYLLSAMTFYDCISNNGQSDMAYAYKRVVCSLCVSGRANYRRRNSPERA